MTITFSEAVTLSGGNLQLDHDASGTDVLISSISSASTASQTYTIAADDVSSDLSITALSYLQALYKMLEEMMLF